jgi:hypothetical protein
MGGSEQKYIQEASDTNWIAPIMAKCYKLRKRFTKIITPDNFEEFILNQK